MKTPYIVSSEFLFFHCLLYGEYIIVEKQRGRPSKMGRKPKKTCKEMTELEHILEENERLRTEVAYLKKLRELRLRDEALQRKRRKQLENWSQEDFD